MGSIHGQGVPILGLTTNFSKIDTAMYLPTCVYTMQGEFVCSDGTREAFTAWVDRPTRQAFWKAINSEFGIDARPATVEESTGRAANEQVHGMYNKAQMSSYARFGSP